MKKRYDRNLRAAFPASLDGGTVAIVTLKPLQTSCGQFSYNTLLNYYQIPAASFSLLSAPSSSLSMLAHVQVFCFLACYTLALLLEISRLWFRSGVRRVITLGLVVAGWIAHTAFLYNSAVEASGSPLSSYRDWMLLAAWVLVLVYFYLAAIHPTTHFGIFFLPLVLGLVVAGWLTPKEYRFAREPSKILGTVHGISMLAATVTVLFGFAAGVMYLWQAKRLKQKRPSSVAVRLPSLEWLQTANARALVISMLLTGLAAGSGIVVKLAQRASGRRACRGM